MRPAPQVGVAVANMLPQITLTGERRHHRADRRPACSGPAPRFWTIGRQRHADRCSTAAPCCTRSAPPRPAFDQAAAQYRARCIDRLPERRRHARALQSDADALQRPRVGRTRPPPPASTSPGASSQLGAVNYLALLNAEQTYEQALINRRPGAGAPLSPTPRRCSRRWAAAGGTAPILPRPRLPPLARRSTTIVSPRA